MSTSSDESRRTFVRQSLGGLASLALSGVAASACKSVPSVPAPCPPIQPNLRIVAIRHLIPAGGAQNLWETVRSTTAQSGAWSTMTPVSSSFLPTGFWDWLDIDEVAVPQGSVYGCEEVHVVGIVNTTPSPTNFFPGQLIYNRQRSDGTWTGFFTLSAGGMGAAATTVPARPFRFSSASAAQVNEELHVCGVTRQAASFARPTGLLLHTMRRYNKTLDDGGFELAQWVAWEDVSTFTPSFGTLVDVSSAGVRNPATGKEELHVCAVTDDGKLWHSIRTGPTTWTVFGDVGAVTGNNGFFTKVDCAADGDLLHVVAVTQNRRALYTIRSPTSWRAFEDVQSAATAPFVQPYEIYDVGIGLYNEGLPAGQWELAIVCVGMAGFTAHYTVRSSQPIAWQSHPFGPSQWKPWTDLEAETAFANSGTLAGVSVAWRPRAT